MKRRSLFYKYVVPIIGIVVVALAASGAISIYFSYQETRNALIALQREKAAAAAARVENFVRGIEHHIGWTSLPQIAEGADPLELRRFDYVKLQKQVPAITESIYVAPNGCMQVQESRLGMSRVGECLERLDKDPRFMAARGDDTYFGPVYFRKETEPYMAIAMRAGRKGAGVTAVDVNLKFIWEVIQQIKVGRKGHAYVVDKEGHLFAHPDISLVLQKTDLSMLPQVKGAIGPAAGAEAPDAEGRDRSGGKVLTAHARIETLGWTVFVEQPIQEAYAPLYAPLIRIAILLLLGLVLSILASLALARYMVRPINALREGAVAIGAGSLEHKIDVKSGDELQDLAEQFNSMAAKLQESYAGLERKVEARTAELKETLDQQTATADILKVISESVHDATPVFKKIVLSCEKLFVCEHTGIVLITNDNKLIIGAHGGPGEAALRALYPMPLAGTSTELSIARRSVMHFPDVAGGPDVPESVRRACARTGANSMLMAPMLWEGKGVGSIYVTRIQAGEFSEKEIDLLKTFADQAVIAVQNSRLFNETKEALEQQTATADILKVISSSPTDVQPVFDAIAGSGVRLFDCMSVAIRLVRGNHLDRVAHAVKSGWEEFGDHAYAVTLGIDDKSVSGRAALHREVVHIPDIEVADWMGDAAREVARRRGYRATVVAPMLREDRAIGTIVVAKAAPGPFSDGQIALLKTFADQAAIAIENVRLFREIQEKSAQLEIANRHKSEFLANMSHELRTPLNAIIGFSEVLNERYFGELNEKQLDYIQDIHASGKHLLSLINDILDLSKIEAGRMELDLASFDMPTALQNALTLVRERAQRHGIALELATDPALGAFRADERKFKQIMLNLLSNAVKFTPEGGKVAVRAKLNGAGVEVAVSDSGVGIAAADQEAIFEEFKQVGSDYTKKAEGTGLGLALTRRFVELHGGTIRVSSAPGQGATFTFTLPLRHG